MQITAPPRLREPANQRPENKGRRRCKRPKGDAAVTLLCRLGFFGGMEDGKIGDLVLFYYDGKWNSPGA